MVLIARVVPPETGLVYSSNNVQLKVNEKIIGKGTLFITDNSLSWQPDNLPDGVTIFWKQIGVHGVSTVPTKSIYFMLDHKLVWCGVYDQFTEKTPTINGQHQNNDAAGDNNFGEEPGDEGLYSDEGDDSSTGDNGEDQLTECWLVPDDANTVETIFQAMSDCQALHPDSADSMSDESDFMDAEEDVNGLGHDIAVEAEYDMQNLNINDDHRFEDADESEN